MAITGSYELLHQSRVINSVQQNSRFSVGAAVTGAVTPIDFDDYLMLTPQKETNVYRLSVHESGLSNTSSFHHSIVPKAPHQCSNMGRKSLQMGTS